jgi:Holliday junction resolvasome RuvABC DNA-binding subunit
MADETGLNWLPALYQVSSMAVHQFLLERLTREEDGEALIGLPATQQERGVFLDRTLSIYGIGARFVLDILAPQQADGLGDAVADRKADLQALLGEANP